MCSTFSDFTPSPLYLYDPGRPIDLSPLQPADIIPFRLHLQTACHQNRQYLRPVAAQFICPHGQSCQTQKLRQCPAHLGPRRGYLSRRSWCKKARANRTRLFSRHVCACVGRVVTWVLVWGPGWRSGSCDLSGHKENSPALAEESG